MKSLLIKSAIASGVVLSLATISRPAMAASFTVTIEDPGKQNANSSKLINSHIQNFDGQAAGYDTQGFQWKDEKKNIGSYSTTLIINADRYGGAGGEKQYFDVDTNRSGNGQTVSTLKLTEAQKYFGLWWSAGDANNELKFLSQGKVIETITTANVVDYIGKLSNKTSYYGNPNETFNNQNSWEPYAFLNFYNAGGTFDEIQFSNNGGTGFESGNHTIATGYKGTSGDVIIKAVPESSSALGVIAIGFVGATSVLTRRVKKKSVLKLS